MQTIEPLVQVGVEWVRLVVEIIGALIVAFGALHAAATFIQDIAARQPANFTRIRLSFARFLTLALEFQLAADILSTAIAPTWDRIGKLGAVAIIRTALNFFLIHEMKEERAEIEEAIIQKENAK
jgi:uncharacterized membrane protein